MMACMLLGVEAVDAQVPVTDGTTGTVVAPLGPGSVVEITGGTTAGSNLFHSFEAFSVPDAGVARFVNDNSAIQNVLSRVTGTMPSSIDGRITTGGLFPDFNLFLINPNGIIFGPGAELDIGGSFFASTGQGIQFGNQGVFSAAPGASTDPNLLTIAPSALLFNQISATQPLNSIAVNGSSLSVPAQQSLVLLGGNPAPTATATGGVLLDGALLESQSGRVEIGAVGGPGSVALGSNFELIFPQDLPKADIVLQNNSVIQIEPKSSGPGGSLSIQANQVEILSRSGLRTEIRGNANAGPITITAQTLRLENGFIASNALGTGDGGQIAIDTQTFQLGDGLIVSNAFGTGNGGQIAIDTQTLRLEDGFITSNAFGTGDGGQIAIDTQTLQLGDTSITSNAFGNGTAGQIFINVVDWIDSPDASEIATNTDDVNPVNESFVPGVGATGGIMPPTNQLNLQPGAQISTSTQDPLFSGTAGDAGDIFMRNPVLLEITDGAGDAGVDTAKLWLVGANATSSSSTSDSGPGGKIEITDGRTQQQDALRLIAQSCQPRGTIALLTITGRGGIALGPSAVPSAGKTFTDLGGVTTANAAPAKSVSTGLDARQIAAPATPNPVIEAQGWVIDEQGEVILVAQAPGAVAPAAGWQVPPSCDRQL